MLVKSYVKLLMTRSIARGIVVGVEKIDVVLIVYESCAFPNSNINLFIHSYIHLFICSFVRWGVSCMYVGQRPDVFFLRRSLCLRKAGSAVSLNVIYACIEYHSRVLVSRVLIHACIDCPACLLLHILHPNDYLDVYELHSSVVFVTPDIPCCLYWDIYLFCFV
jgi:hypothetical protein